MRKLVGVLFLFLTVLFMAGCDDNKLGKDNDLEINEYTLTYVDYDGTVLQTADYATGSDLSDVSPPFAPSRLGYTFDSWSGAVESEMGTKDITITALFSVNQYTVEYIDYDKSTIQTYNYDFGADLSGVTAPENPERMGYTFTGWDTTVPAKMGTDNVKIAATYLINQYIVEYIDYDGTVILSNEYEYGANLDEIVVPNDLTRESFIFNGWIGSIPNTMGNTKITMIASYSLNTQSGLENEEYRYTISGNEAIIIKYLGTNTHVIIPDEIDGFSVTEISEEAYKKLDIETIVLPSTLKVIGEYAFAYNRLRSIVIPEGVTTIGAGAFSSGDYIGNWIEDLVLPSTLIIIGESSFWNNRLTSVIIPEGVTLIEDRAFSRNELRNVVLNEGLTTIGSYAFSDNVISNIALPSTITTIYNHAFYDNWLESITIPEGVIDIGSSAFASNSLTDVKLSSTIETMGWNAFYDNEITNITIPEGITSIGNAAFSSNNLTNVTLPTTLVEIGFNAFYNNEITNIVIPEGVKIIGVCAFQGNKLESVTLPSTLIEIERCAFRGNQITNLSIPEGITTIGDEAFYENQLSSVTLPNTLTSIGEKAFMYNLLETITIPSEVLTIGDEAFSENQWESVVILGDEIRFNTRWIFIDFPYNLKPID